MALELGGKAAPEKLHVARPKVILCCVLRSPALATQEAQIRKMTVQSQPRHIFFEALSQEYPK
jgi:hypothetical protein